MGLNYKGRKRIFLLCSTTVLHGLQKSLPLDSQKYVPNSLAHTLQIYYPAYQMVSAFCCLMVKLLGLEPDAWELGLLSKIRRKETVLQDDKCKHADQIKASTDILLISIVSKRLDLRSQNVPTMSKRPNLQSQNGPTISKRPNLQSQNGPTISKCPTYLKMSQSDVKSCRKL